MADIGGPNVVQRLFGGAPQSRGTQTCFLCAVQAPGSAAHRCATSYALRCVRGTRQLLSERAFENGKSLCGYAGNSDQLPSLAAQLFAIIR
jgi:hypothetical protein